MTGNMLSKICNKTSTESTCALRDRTAQFPFFSMGDFYDNALLPTSQRSIWWKIMLINLQFIQLKKNVPESFLVASKFV